ncbi:MAG: HEAT repeat domain-containing protein [Planctomycetaceae bacterium]|nr:HEAT repeat domain-containing protein [Planctomycetaceae bacterium]
MTYRRLVLPALLIVGLFVTAGQAKAQQDDRSEADLIAALDVKDDSNASVRQFMLAVKPLAQRGTEACIPALVAKLGNPRFAHYARFALEPNPSPKVDEALFAALKTLDGDLLIGVINSIGVRKAPGAYQALMVLADRYDIPSIKMEDKKEIAKAGFAAFGELGTIESADLLIRTMQRFQNHQEYKILLSSVADASFACARHLENAGNSAKAIELYDAVLGLEMPGFVHEAATFKGILARKEAGLDVVVKNLSSDNWAIFAATMKAVRVLPGDNVSKTLLAELEKLDAPRKAMLLEAIGDRGDKAALPALIGGVKSENEAIRLAAIRALMVVGDVSAVDVLLDAAIENDGNSAVAKAAQYTLIWIPGDAVDQKIVDILKNGKPAAQAVAIKLVEERRIKEAFPIIWEMMGNNDEKVRQAAAQAIAQTGGLDSLENMFEMLLHPAVKERVGEIQWSMKGTAGRLPQEECATKVIELYEKAPKGEAKLFLLELLATVKGKKAVDFVASQAWGDDAAAKDKAIEVLGAWTDTDVADALLKIAKESSENRYKNRAIRGYIRLARQFNMSEEDRIAICKNVFDVATRDDDKVLIFDVIRRNPTEKMLVYAATFFDNDTLREKAFEAAVAVADRIQGKPAIVDETMNKVIAETQNADLKAKAQRIVDRK